MNARATTQVGSRIADAERRNFVGRRTELDLLLHALDEHGPTVSFVHGIGGIGKSTLLSVFVFEARSRGAAALELHGQSVEPTDVGFLRSLAQASGAKTPSLAAVTRRLAALGDPVILVVDSYEVLRLADTWLRQSFVPSLPVNVRLVLAGRDSPVWTWSSTPGLRAVFQRIELKPLSDDEAREVLARNGVSSEAAALINAFANGHPLALQLAIAAGRDHRELTLEHAPSSVQQRVIDELARLFLSDIDDERTREALEAASTVRRVTIRLLAAMLPRQAPQDAFDRLRALPFVEASADGLRLHDSVRAAIGARLSAADPGAYREYRQAAWGVLRAELRNAATHELWRSTADVLFLLENPVLRDAFFPRVAHDLAIESAVEGDFAALEGIVRAHEGPVAAEALLAWLEELPTGVLALRASGDRVAGLSIVADVHDCPETLVRRDPVLAACLAHERASPMANGERALIHRRWLGRVEGELPSPVQAASMLDVKRHYLTMRAHLRRVYICASELSLYAPALNKLGFRPLEGAPTELDGRTYSVALLDFGPKSVDGWLAGLIEAELGIGGNALTLDADAHEVVLAGGRVPLTPLEFGVMRQLSARRGQVVQRTSLIADVWGYDYDGGSNVVDVVIKGIRQKLGDDSSAIETVRGAGYRLRADEPR